MTAALLAVAYAVGVITIVAALTNITLYAFFPKESEQDDE